MKNYQNEIIAAVSMLGKIALAYAKDNCPVRTGRLKNSIALTQPLERSSGNTKAVIGTDVPYAKHVEFGGGRRKPRNFLGGAVEAARERVIDVFSIFIRGR